MSFDLSRKNFNPLDDYFGVIMQQGRVQMDADWNALVAQISRRLQAESLDTFGTAVVPRETPDGFLISGSASALEIGAGRIYVDGLLAENHTQTLKWDARLAEISGTARLSGANLDATPSGPAGTTAYDEQAYYPNPPPLPEAGNYLVYVDTWQRDITYLQDASLIDAAVGVDTTARQQNIWQVKFLDDVGILSPDVTDLDIPGWLETIHPSSARLSTATGNLTNDDNPCLLPPQAGYKGLENQLYRVQVHDAGGFAEATFKWSRDNATVASKISAISVGGQEIVVDSLGRDEVLGFKPGDWVEVTDDFRTLKGIPGELRRISLGDGIDSATRTIRLDGNPLPSGLGDGEFHIDDPGDSPVQARNTRVIRWDQAGIVFREDETEYTNLDTSNGAIEIPAAGTRLFLEKGILVDFDLEAVVDEANFEPQFKAGDYWIFHARVNDASLDLLDRSPPAGMHHHYTKLAIVADNIIHDCRSLWPPDLGGENCACTICVHPDTHNNGSATIQQAVDQVNSLGGGTVCLSVGEYQVDTPIRISGNSIALRGQGWQSLLISRKPGVLIELGGEDVASNISIESITGVTSTIRGFIAAIKVNNVLGFTLKDCLIANFAAESGTSQAIQFTGLAAMIAISQCSLLAEQGVSGPRLQDDYLGSMDFSIRDCLIAGSQRGISFREMSFHLGTLDISNNHISDASDTGIELSGMVLDSATVDIRNNLINDCVNAIRSGVSRLRITDNDLEITSDSREAGNGITLLDGLDPESSTDQQIMGNRVSNYGGHAITVQTGVGKLMVKQNQINAIVGAAFIVEAGGSIDYLSLENNQFSGIDGLTGDDDLVAALSLQASVRADISNNIFDRIVQNNQVASTRAGILITSSSEVRISGNRLFSVTPASYAGLGAGIIISSTVGSFEVDNNKVSRIPENSDQDNARIVAAAWLPLLVIGRQDPDDSRDAGRDLTGTRATGFTNDFANDFTSIRSNIGTLAPTSALLTVPPVVNINNSAYAILSRDLINLGATALSKNSVSINANRLDGSSSTSVSVAITVGDFCGFTSNEVTSSNPGVLVYLAADHIAANNNRLMTTDDLDILVLQARRYVLMGNMSTGNISVLDGAESNRPPEPWSSLNILI